MKGKKLSHKERLEKLESDSAERRKVFKELQDHVAQGLSVESFPELSVTSIREYFKRYPEEFDQDELEKSLRKGRVWWESIGTAQANGSCLGNSRTWYYNMVNRYGWHEKAQIETEHKGNLNVNIVSYSSRKASPDTPA